MTPAVIDLDKCIATTHSDKQCDNDQVSENGLNMCKFHYDRFVFSLPDHASEEDHWKHILTCPWTVFTNKDMKGLHWRLGDHPLIRHMLAVVMENMELHELLYNGLLLVLIETNAKQRRCNVDSFHYTDHIFSICADLLPHSVVVEMFNKTCNIDLHEVSEDHLQIVFDKCFAPQLEHVSSDIVLLHPLCIYHATNPHVTLAFQFGCHQQLKELVESRQSKYDFYKVKQAYTHDIANCLRDFHHVCSNISKFANTFNYKRACTLLGKVEATKSWRGFNRWCCDMNEMLIDIFGSIRRKFNNTWHDPDEEAKKNLGMFICCVSFASGWLACRRVETHKFVSMQNEWTQSLAGDRGITYALLSITGARIGKMNSSMLSMIMYYISMNMNRAVDDVATCFVKSEREEFKAHVNTTLAAINESVCADVVKHCIQPFIQGNVVPFETLLALTA
jgi:hypothetical protein